MKLVETPPGPPVIASVVAEVYGQPDHRYEDLLAGRRHGAGPPGRRAGRGRRGRRARSRPDEAHLRHRQGEGRPQRHHHRADRRHAASRCWKASTVGLVRSETERNPLRIELRLPVDRRTSAADLARVHVKGSTGPTGAAGRTGPLGDGPRGPDDLPQEPPARGLRVRRDRRPAAGRRGGGHAGRSRSADRCPLATAVQAASATAGWPTATPRPVGERTFFSNGSGIAWGVPAGFTVDFAGEGEWKITLDVFRDLGLAFGAAMIAIYVLLVAQTGSFAVPVVVMLAIPLTILGVMPGFWLLNALSAQQVGGFLDPVYFTATGMIGMIALAGIVTRDSIILVDFIHLSLARGRSLFDAIMESRVVRLRPILLTAGAAMLGGRADHHRPDLLRPGLVADLRPVRLDGLHAVRDPGGLLAALRQQARPRPAAIDDGTGRSDDRAGADSASCRFLVTVWVPPGVLHRGMK